MSLDVLAEGDALDYRRRAQLQHYVLRWRVAVREPSRQLIRGFVHHNIAESAMHIQGRADGSIGTCSTYLSWAFTSTFV